MIVLLFSALATMFMLCCMSELTTICGTFVITRYRGLSTVTRLKKGLIVECGLNVSTENEMLSLTLPDVSTINYIFHATKVVCSALLSQKSDMPWPPNSSDMNKANVAVPTCLQHACVDFND